MRKRFKYPPIESKEPPFYSRLFWEKLLREVSRPKGRKGCLEWPEVKLQLGYPIICAKIGSKKNGWSIYEKLGVHRIALWLKCGVYTSRAERQHACHSCNNSWCINPNHLYLGDGATNHHDRVTDHRRRKKSLGSVFEYKKRRFFGSADVRRLRGIFWRRKLSKKAPAVTATELARAEGVGLNCMYRMLHGIDYSDLAMPPGSIRRQSRTTAKKSKNQDALRSDTEDAPAES